MVFPNLYLDLASLPGPKAAGKNRITPPA